MGEIADLKKRVWVVDNVEGESLKDYASRVMNLVSQIKLFRGEFKDQRIIEKMMVCLPEKFESKLSVTEKTCDLEVYCCWTYQ